MINNKSAKTNEKIENFSKDSSDKKCKKEPIGIIQFKNTITEILF